MPREVCPDGTPRLRYRVLCGPKASVVRRPSEDRIIPPARAVDARLSREGTDRGDQASDFMLGEKAAPLFSALSFEQCGDVALDYRAQARAVVMNLRRLHWLR